jgi:hypothetical protein
MLTGNTERKKHKQAGMFSQLSYMDLQALGDGCKHARHADFASEQSIPLSMERIEGGGVEVCDSVYR